MAYTRKETEESIERWKTRIRETQAELKSKNPFPVLTDWDRVVIGLNIKTLERYITNLEAGFDPYDGPPTPRRVVPLPHGGLVYQRDSDPLTPLPKVPGQPYFVPGEQSFDEWVDPMDPYYDLSGDLPVLINPREPLPKIPFMG